MNEPNCRHIAVEKHGAELVVAIQEKALRDTTTCYAIRDEITTAIDTAKATNVVLDMSAVEFVGSVGILAFLGARRRLPAGRVILCGMSPNVREVFLVCALIPSDARPSGPFETAETVACALATLKSPTA
jgi:anti-anti-sigma factor